MSNRKKSPDHTDSPAAFAYALRHKVFTKEEESILFDHGQTKESFIKIHEQEIAKKILDLLLTEQKIPEATGSINDCCEVHN